MFQLEILGRALRWLREDRGMKQDDVAQTAGITRPMLSAYERGRVQPTLDTLDRLLRALDCDLNALSQALKIVTSMGKVGRKHLTATADGEAHGSTDAADRPDTGKGDGKGTHRGLTLVTDNLESGPAVAAGSGERAPFTFDGLERVGGSLDPDEEAAFHELLAVQRRWLLTLRRSMIRQMRAEPSASP